MNRIKELEFHLVDSHTSPIDWDDKAWFGLDSRINGLLPSKPQKGVKYGYKNIFLEILNILLFFIYVDRRGYMGKIFLTL